MKLKNIVLLFILLYILCSCALLGPDYKKPVVQTPNKWQENSTNTLSSESNVDISNSAWWRIFNDNNLNQLIENSLINNNDIQTAIGNITIAAGNLQQIKMAWVPTVSLGGTTGIGQSFAASNTINNSTLSSLNNNSSISNSTNNFNFYSGGLIPSYSLNIFQQLKKQDAAQLNLELATANKNAIRLAIISQVSGSYFTLLALNDQLENQQNLLKHLDKLLELAKIQLKYGLATQSDVDNYQQKLSQAKMQLPVIEHNIVITTNAIRVLVNDNSEQISNISRLSSITTNSVIPINLPSTVLNYRPDIKIAEAQVKIANANIGVATSNFFPHIYLTTPVGGYNSQLGELFAVSGDFWIAQISATMPILNLGLYGIIKQAKGQYYVTYYNYIKTVRSAFAEVNNNLSGYEKIQQVYTEANILFNANDSSSKLSQLNYQNGYISYTDNLASQVALDNAKIMLSQTKLQQLQAIISLYQSLAAGYNYNNTDKAKQFGNGHDV